MNPPAPDPLVSPTPIGDALPVGIAAVDANGRQTYVNAAFARMVGWPVEVLIGAMPPFVYWPPDRMDEIGAAFEATLRGEVPVGGWMLQFLRQDGSRFDAVVHLGQLDGTGSIAPGWVAAVTDVSDRERSARRLAALQSATASLTESLTAAEVAEEVVRVGLPALGAARGSVALLRADGQSVEILASIGYSEDTVERFRTIPLSVRFPLSDAVRESIAILLPSAEARAARYPHLDELRRANGGGAMAALPLIVEGRTLGALGMNWSDDHPFDPEERAFLVSLAQQCAQALERARLYEEERRARAEAERANRAKSDFLASMSHELRTPLNGIKGYVDLLLMELRGPLTDDQRTDLERIRRNQMHLQTLIEDVLSFARLEAGRLNVERGPVPVDETLRSLEPVMLPEFRERGIRYHYAGCDPELMVEGDQDRIVQICLNLLSNAGKATPEGGTVDVQCVAGEREIQIGVTDTGAGIPADQLEAIFSPFTQLGRTYNAPRGGAGLGLAISRELAEAMGGTLRVASQVDVGSTFTLVLPRLRPDR